MRRTLVDQADDARPRRDRRVLRRAAARASGRPARRRPVAWSCRRAPRAYLEWCWRRWRAPAPSSVPAPAGRPSCSRTASPASWCRPTTRSSSPMRCAAPRRTRDRADRDGCRRSPASTASRSRRRVRRRHRPARGVDRRPVDGPADDRAWANAGSCCSTWPPTPTTRSSVSRTTGSGASRRASAASTSSRCRAGRLDAPRRTSRALGRQGASATASRGVRVELSRIFARGCAGSAGYDGCFAHMHAAVRGDGGADPPAREGSRSRSGTRTRRRPPTLRAAVAVSRHGGHRRRRSRSTSRLRKIVAIGHGVDTSCSGRIPRRRSPRRSPRRSACFGVSRVAPIKGLELLVDAAARRCGRRARRRSGGHHRRAGGAGRRRVPAGPAAPQRRRRPRRDRCRFPGPVPRADLPALLRGASVA